MKNLLWVLSLVLLANHSAFADEPITEKNWASHPQIVEVRMLYQKIMAEKAAGKLRRKAREFDCSLAPDFANREPDYEGYIRILYTDRSGKPRIYYHEGGSEDSMVRIELYYDDNGKLRFALTKGGAVNNTKMERRTYFSRSGEKIWDDDKILEGPGYSFVEWGLVDDPVREFNGKGSCPEAKPRARAR
jgi:hypothetical protein